MDVNSSASFVSQFSFLVCKLYLSPFSSKEISVFLNIIFVLFMIVG
jgi:hypothetical protein